MASAWRLLWVAYVVATAMHIGVVMAHEPFAYDAWNMARDTQAEPFSAGNFLAYGIDQYTHSNPRLGQWFTYLSYKLEYFAVIATPLAFLALALAVTVLGLGRWPSWRRGRDLALYAITLGFLWFALPHIGMVMFSRGYGANYVYGAVVQLWFLVPLRLLPRGDAALGWCVAYFFLGLFAGASNEHTGPTLVLFALGYAAWRHREGTSRPTLAFAGAFGAVMGFAAIFFAPGQGERYDGLAGQVSLLGRLVQRGITKNLEIVSDFVVGAAPVIALIVIVLVIGARDEDRAGQRAPLRMLGWVIVAGLLVTATLFVSPKLGPRFYLHSCALLLAGLIGLSDVVLTSTRRLVPFVLLAVAASAYAGARTIPLYLRLHEGSEVRLATLSGSTPGAVVTTEALDQVEESWWFLGDDFRYGNKLEMVATYFGLREVILRAVDVDAPLGVSDVRFVPRYAVTPARCLDQVGGIELGTFRGLHVATIQQAMHHAVDRLRDKLGERGSLDQVELVVDFLGDPPPLPRPTVLLGRWTPDRFDAWAGVIRRQGKSRTRTVVLPKELRETELEIYIYRVGDEARRLGTARQEVLAYQPWRPGAYWALACTPAECFVIAATRML